MGGTLTITKGTATLAQVPKRSGTATVSGAKPGTPPGAVVTWDAVQDKPEFGTASLRDAPASGNAAPDQVVLGDDTRLPATLPLPVAQGGTGATTGTQALNNLGAVEEAPDNANTYARKGKGWVVVPDPPSYPLAIAQGGTGATTAGQALTNLGGTTIGVDLFTANDDDEARMFLGAGIIGDQLFVAGTAAAARTVLGAGAFGDSMFLTATAVAARTLLGGTATGIALFTAASASAARTTLGATTIGSNIFTAADAAAVRVLLGATTIGTQLFTAATAAAARGFIGAIADAPTDGLQYARKNGAWDVVATSAGGGYQEFTASNPSWPKPAGASYLYFELVSGGGAGGSGANLSGGSFPSTQGGGGGVFASYLRPASDFGSTISVVVGAGGTASLATVFPGISGGPGGSSSFGSYSVPGGLGGAATNTPTSPNVPYTLALTSILAFGSDNFASGGFAQSVGANSLNGGGGGGGAGASAGTRAGGTSVNAGAGGAGRSTSGAVVVGDPGSYPGGGGGAAATFGAGSSATGGAGAAGRVRVWWW